MIILSLKALTEYARFSRRTAESGTMVLYHQNKQVGAVSYEKGYRGEIVINGIEEYIQAGKQNCIVLFAGTQEALPYSLNVSWTSYTPNSSSAYQVDLETGLSDTKIQTGKTVRLRTILTRLRKVYLC